MTGEWTFLGGKRACYITNYQMRTTPLKEAGEGP